MFKLNTYQLAVIAMIEEIKKNKDCKYLSSERNLLENKFLALKLPRRVGKTYLINSLALLESNPLILGRSLYTKEVYTPILRKHIFSSSINLLGCHTDYSAVFFDEFTNKQEITNILRQVQLSNRGNKIKYVLSLYT